MGDIYTQIAASMFSKPEVEVTPEERLIAKNAMYMHLFSPTISEEVKPRTIGVGKCIHSHEWPVTLMYYRRGPTLHTTVDEKLCSTCGMEIVAIMTSTGDLM